MSRHQLKRQFVITTQLAHRTTSLVLSQAVGQNSRGWTDKGWRALSHSDLPIHHHHHFTKGATICPDLHSSSRVATDRNLTRWRNSFHTFTLRLLPPSIISPSLKLSNLLSRAILIHTYLQLGSNFDRFCYGKLNPLREIWE